MFLPEQFAMRRRGNWCAVVVLVAICALTIRVATRYSSPTDSSASAIRTVARLASTHQAQRLVKAANWIAPALCSAVFQPTPSYPHLIAAAPLTPNRIFAEALYTRPPPSSEPFV